MPADTNEDKLTRSKQRVSDLGEVFTPTPIVRDMLALIPEDSWSDPSMVCLEPTCGNGQFVEEIVAKKIQHGLDPVDAINTTFAMDIMEDNIADTRLRVLVFLSGKMNQTDFKKKSGYIIAILVNNIFQANSLDFINSGKFEGVPFVKKDPTGNKQVLPRKEWQDLKEKAEELKKAYKKWGAK